MAGAFLGGVIGTMLGEGSITGFNMTSIQLGIVGAILLLVIYRMIRGRRTHHTHS